MSVLPQFKAVLFDMDGVIADTQNPRAVISLQVFQDLFGLEMDLREFNDRFSGMKTEDIASTLLTIEKGFSQSDIDKYIQTRYDRVYSDLASMVKPIEGIFELLDKLDQLGMVYSVGTGAKYKTAKIILETLNIKDRFAHIIASDMVDKAKPDPAVYLKCMELMGIGSHETIIIEDAANGIEAARRAGVFSVGIATDNHHQIRHSNLKIDNFSQLLDILGDK
jgi:beta-phosphoglucomutase